MLFGGVIRLTIHPGSDLLIALLCAASTVLVRQFSKLKSEYLSMIDSLRPTLTVLAELNQSFGSISQCKSVELDTLTEMVDYKRVSRLLEEVEAVMAMTALIPPLDEADELPPLPSARRPAHSPRKKGHARVRPFLCGKPPVPKPVVH